MTPTEPTANRESPRSSCEAQRRVNAFRGQHRQPKIVSSGHTLVTENLVPVGRNGSGWTVWTTGLDCDLWKCIRPHHLDGLGKGSSPPSDTKTAHRFRSHRQHVPAISVHSGSDTSMLIGNRQRDRTSRRNGFVLVASTGGTRLLRAGETMRLPLRPKVPITGNSWPRTCAVPGVRHRGGAR